jgi:hypothetical protein
MNTAATAASTATTTPGFYLYLFLFLFVAVVIVVVWGARPDFVCPTSLHRRPDGTLRVEPQGFIFNDMNEFETWLHGQGRGRCELPPITGGGGGSESAGWGSEQTYAKTPINKVDDYEFSRIFGYEKNGRMEIPPQNFNLILNQRSFDWPDKPLTSDERRTKYMGLVEGFTADGSLESVFVPGNADADTLEATQTFVGGGGGAVEDDDVSCSMSRKSAEVAKLVAKAYKNDTDYEPVITRIGANHWEVNELKPRRKPSDDVVPYQHQYQYQQPHYGGGGRDAADVQFRYREREVQNAAIDPYFPPEGAGETSDVGGFGGFGGDPYVGPVPGMERMFGPTFDRKNWIVSPTVAANVG